jgi:hypothetical protein
MKALFTFCALVWTATLAAGLWMLWAALPLWALPMAIAAYLPVATWLLYLAAMNVDRVEETLGLPETANAIQRVVWPLAAVHNCALNATVLVVVFLDPPRELATTKRLNRYVDGPDGWRRRWALWIRAELLNNFDRRGVHT